MLPSPVTSRRYPARRFSCSPRALECGSSSARAMGVKTWPVWVSLSLMEGGGGGRREVVPRADDLLFLFPNVILMAAESVKSVARGPESMIFLPLELEPERFRLMGATLGVIALGGREGRVKLLVLVGIGLKLVVLMILFLALVCGGVMFRGRTSNGFCVEIFT